MGKVKQRDIDNFVKKKKVDKLLSLLFDDNQELRKNIILALGKLGDSKAIAPLCKVFTIKYDFALYPDVVNALIRIGPSCIDELHEVTIFKNEEALKSAARIYVQLLTEKSYNYLMELTKNPNERVKNVVLGLLKSYNENITAYLVSALDDPNLGTRKTAAIRLIEKGDIEWKKGLSDEVQNKILNALEVDEALKSHNEVVRSTALEKVAKEGLKAIPRLLLLLTRPESEIVEQARNYIKKFGTAAVIPLISELSNSAPKAKLEIISILAQIKDPLAYPPLYNLMHDPDVDISAAAIDALGTLGDIQSLDPIALLYNSTSEKIREKVALVLGKFKDIRGLGALLYLIGDPAENVQVTALKSVGLIKNAQALPYLYPLIKNTNPNIAAAAIEAIGKIGGDNVASNLRSVIKSEHIMVRRAAVTALGAIGGAQVIDPLCDLLTDSEPIIVTIAAQALGNLQAVQAVRGLINVLKGENESAQRIAATALGRIGTVSLNPLLTCLTDPHVTTREYALEALGEIGDPRIYDALVWVIDNEQVEAVKEIAANILQDYQKEGKIPAFPPEIAMKIQHLLVKKIKT